MIKSVDANPPLITIVVTPAATLVIAASLVWVGISIILAGLLIASAKKPNEQLPPLVVTVETKETQTSPPTPLHTVEGSQETPTYTVTPSVTPSPTVSPTSTPTLTPTITMTATDKASLVPTIPPTNTLAAIFQTATAVKQNPTPTPSEGSVTAPIATTPPKTMIVTNKDGLNVRSCPSVNCAVVGYRGFLHYVDWTGDTVEAPGLVWYALVGGQWIAGEINGVLYLQ